MIYILEDSDSDNSGLLLNEDVNPIKVQIMSKMTYAILCYSVLFSAVLCHAKLC